MFRQIRIELEEGLHKELKMICINKNVSMRQFIRDMIYRYIKNNYITLSDQEMDLLRHKSEELGISPEDFVLGVIISNKSSMIVAEEYFSRAEKNQDQESD